jgi:Dyp-type peroxidase family
VWSDQNSRDAELQLEIDDIQGDIVVGLQKNFEWFIFFNIIEPDSFRVFARKSLIPRISSAADVLQWELALQAGKKAGQTQKLPFVGVNLGFTKLGLDKLGAPGSVDDPAFNNGLASRSELLNDPQEGEVRAGKEGEFSAAKWKVGGPNNTPHGVILITGSTQAIVDRVKEELTGPLQANQDRTEEDQTEDERANGWKVTYAERGMTRQISRSREHFGFQDGISQPSIRGRIDRIFPDRKFLQLERNPNNPAEALQGSDLVWPGEFVFGYPSSVGSAKGPSAQTVAEPDGPGNLATGGVPWARNGSLMVIRRLNQFVPEFNRLLESKANRQNQDPELTGAGIVGRWKSGAPISLAPFQDDSSLGTDASRNNDFNFTNDPQGRRCPLSAHIRKAYPRSTTDTTYSNRLIRRGIPFGPELQPDEKETVKKWERGLMFVCYQTSIVNQFEFITRRLSDQSKNQADPDPFLEFVRPTGGGYFFIPSINIFKTLVEESKKYFGLERIPPLEFDQTDLKQVFLRLHDLFNAADYDGMKPLMAMDITWKKLHRADSITGVGNVVQWLKDNQAYQNPQFLPEKDKKTTLSFSNGSIVTCLNCVDTFLEDGGAQIRGQADWQASRGSGSERIQYCFNFVREANRWFLINAFGTVIRSPANR